MDIKKLQTIVIDALEDVKGHDIRAFDTVHLTSLYDRLTIASGTSNRQTKALAASVRDKVKENGGTVISIEGEDTGEWVLVDLGEMVVHIMQPAIRDYYRLEEIWGDKEIKLGAAKRTSKRTASAEEDGEIKPKRTSRHLAATQAIDDDDAPKKPARKTAAKTATKTAVKTATKTAAKKAAKTPAGKRVKVAASKSATAAKKAPAKRASRAKAE